MEEEDTQALLKEIDEKVSKDMRYNLKNATKDELCSWSLPVLLSKAQPFVLRGYTAGITSVAFSPNSSRYLTGSTDKTV